MLPVQRFGGDAGLVKGPGQDRDVDKAGLEFSGQALGKIFLDQQREAVVAVFPEQRDQSGQ